MADLAGVLGGLDFHQLAVEAAAREAGISPSLLRALIQVESGGNKEARSPMGAVGFTQMTPGAAEEVGMHPRDIHDPGKNLRGGAEYMARMLQMFGGDVPLAAAAYNAGPSAVKKYKGVPPYAETKGHGRKLVKLYLDLMKQQMMGE